MLRGITSPLDQYLCMLLVIHLSIAIMTTLLCIPSPPFGASFWTEVCKRLESQDQPTKIVTPFLSAYTLDQAIQYVDNELSSIQDSVVIVTHGASLNIGLALSSHPKVCGVVLTNGSVSGPSPLLRVVSSVPTSLWMGILQPSIATTLFSSSVGMRRWVVNPYVMNRDMVVRVCQDFLQDKAYRNNCLKWLANKEVPLSLPAQTKIPFLSIWGTHDFFHPISERQHLDQLLSEHTAIDVPGGRYLHALERPWETADSIVGWMKKWKL